jgi:glycosyltransferase involved in cell wall biosynthesis
MKIGVEGYSKDYEHLGPAISVFRMMTIVQEMGLGEIEAVHCWKNDINLFKITAPRWYWTPYILRLDGIYYDKNNTLGDSNLLNAPIFKSAKRAKALFFISEFSRQLLFNFYKPLDKPSVVIHNSIDLKNFSNTGNDMRGSLGIHDDDFVIVTSAKWRRHKRLKETVELFQLISKNYDRNFKLLVLGDGEIEKVDDANVIYAGQIHPQELAVWYRTGDLYLHLCAVETCGNTQIEAMACGLPVLCTNNGGIGETVLKANGGIVSQADKPFPFTMIDNYNPQAPDYDVLMNDFEKIYQDIETYKMNIKRETLDIRLAARQFIEFAEKVVYA